MRSAFKFAMQPFPYQQEEFERTRNRVTFARFWEMGTGKSKVTLDEAVYLYSRNEIDGLVVVAPNGVHTNWILEEITKHIADNVRFRGVGYKSSIAGTNYHKEELQAVHDFNGFAVLAISYDGFLTETGKAFVKSFLLRRRCMMVLDESTRIKNPKADTTKVLYKAAKFAPVRRILTGTPIDDGPFDVYAQMKFLDEDIWKQHGLANYNVFKATFGIFRNCVLQSGRVFPQLVAYKNLDMLRKIVSDNASRVLKKDVLDLPEKLYSNHFVEMTPKQRKIYETMERECSATIEGRDGDVEVFANIPLTKLLRLQQITCGYLPVDEEEPRVLIDKENPRLDALEQIITDAHHPCLIFSRFTPDIDLICQRLGKSAVRYDGTLDDAGKQESLDKFHSGECPNLVINSACGATGLTLVEAQTVVYYSNSFRYGHRLQSEDRAHRIGQRHAVNYIDLIAERSVDQHIVKALMRKADFADQVTGDAARTWVSATDQRPRH